MFFETGGKPLIISTEGRGFRADFVLATLVETRDLQPPNSQVLLLLVLLLL
jgi:hypothetical protein